MKYNPDIHHRQSIRLRGYDYSQNGLYFITICTQNREHLFGRITNGQMALNPMGEIAHNEWFKTESMRPNIRLHEFIVMPNHIHGIIEIIPVGAHCMRPLDTRPHDAPPTTDNHGQSEPGDGQSGRVQRAPTNTATTIFVGQRAPTVGDIVRGYKSAVTKRINEIRNMSGVPVWQRNYHEHMIRNETAHLKIADYTQTNPQRWQEDTYHD